MLEHDIRTAFARTRHPGDDRITYGQHEGHLECMDIAQAFRGRTDWSELELDFLREQSDALYFFTPEAFLFYLPAYLVAIVRHGEEADTIIDAVVSTTAPIERSSSEFDVTRNRSLDRAQRRVIDAVVDRLRIAGLI